MPLSLTKHHGLGNDFLVLLDLAGTRPVGPDDARAVCDRTTGVGADGLIRATATADADARMELWNSDGSAAELSGNGLRCLAQALLLAGDVVGPTMSIASAHGVHAVSVQDGREPSTHEIVADLGPVTIDDRAIDWLLPGVRDAVFARIENPHLVLHTPEPVTAPNLVEVGEAANEKIDGGVNVEMIRVAGDELVLDVYERGAGRTQACGTGACAAAAVAHRWSLVPEQVTVHMPGGAAVVTVGDTVTLAGPIHAVARVEFPWP
jgi:diaminopimelate epimerase